MLVAGYAAGGAAPILRYRVELENDEGSRITTLIFL